MICEQHSPLARVALSKYLHVQYTNIVVTSNEVAFSVSASAPPHVMLCS